MTRIYHFVLFSLIFSVFGGCCPIVLSENPLTAASTAVYDSKLEGTWKYEGDDTLYIHIGQFDINETSAIVVQHKPKGRISTMVFKMFSSLIDGENYLNVQTHKICNQVISTNNNYFFIKYRFKKNGDLSLSFLQDKAIFAAAINQDQLQGEVKYKAPRPGENTKNPEIECVFISDSSDNVNKFLKNNKKSLFTESITMQKL